MIWKVTLLGYLNIQCRKCILMQKTMCTQFPTRGFENGSNGHNIATTAIRAV
eukprot:c38772_g1_i1 orf=79-234(-)